MKAVRKSEVGARKLRADKWGKTIRKIGRCSRTGGARGGGKRNNSVGAVEWGQEGTIPHYLGPTTEWCNRARKE